MGEGDYGGLLTFRVDRRSRWRTLVSCGCPRMMWFTRALDGRRHQPGRGNCEPQHLLFVLRAYYYNNRTAAHHRARAHRQAQCNQGAFLLTEGPRIVPGATDGRRGKAAAALTADGYAPTQPPCSRDDAPIIVVLDCMRAQAPKASTLHKIRAYLRGVYKLPVTVKSVPLRALLTAYPGNFVFLTATSLGERGQKIIAL